MSKSMGWFLYDNGLHHERVKVLTGRKFDISFFLEVLLSRGETMTFLVSSGKMPFDKLLFIDLTKVDTKH